MPDAMAFAGNNMYPTSTSGPSRPSSSNSEDTKDPFASPFDGDKQHEGGDPEEEWWNEGKHDELTDVEELEENEERGKNNDFEEDEKLEEDEERGNNNDFEESEELEDSAELEDEEELTGIDDIPDEECPGNPENTPVIPSTSPSVSKSAASWPIFQQNNYYIGDTNTFQHTVTNNTVNRYSVTKPTRERSRARQRKQNAEAGIKVITDFSPNAGSSQAPQAGQRPGILAGSVEPQAGNLTLQTLDKEAPVQPTGWNFWSKKARDQKAGATKSSDKGADTTDTPSFSTQSGSKLGRRSLAPALLKLEQDLSPNDRPIVIGLTVSSTKLTEYAQSPQTVVLEVLRLAQNCQDQRRAYTSPETQTPSIMVTHASDDPAWPLGDKDQRAPERRPASSIYSQASPNPHSHDRVPSIPAVPAYMMRAHAGQGTNRAIPSRESTNTVFDEDDAFPQRSPTWRISTFTVREDDETRPREPAAMIHATNFRPAQNESLSTPTTYRRSKGWWTYVMTPFMTRSNTVAAKQTAMKEGQPTTPNLEAAAIKARNSDRADQVWEKQYSPTTATSKSSETWWDRNRNDAEPQNPERSTTGEFERRRDEYVRTHRAQESSATLPFVMSGAIDAHQVSRQPPLPSNNRFTNRDRESASTFVTRRTESDLARQASAATAFSNNDRDIPLIFDIDSPVRTRGNPFLPPRPTVPSSSNSLGILQTNQYENYPPPPPPPAPINITNITYNIGSGSRDHSESRDGVRNNAEFLSRDGVQNDSRSSSRDRAPNDSRITAQEQEHNNSQTSYRELLPNDSQFTARDRIGNNSWSTSRERVQNDSWSTSQGQVQSDARETTREQVLNSSQIDRLGPLSQDIRSASQDRVQNGSRPNPPSIQPPYSPPRARLARFGQQEVAHTTSNNVQNQRSSSPGPISPGMEQVMTSAGGIPMYNVPLESPRRRPINLNSGYPSSLPPRNGAYIKAADMETSAELARQAEAKRKRSAKKESLKQKIGGLWKGAKRGCSGKKEENGQKKKKKKRRMWYCIAFLLIIALILSLFFGLLERKKSSSVELTQWLSLTGFPSIFLGVSTVAVPINTLTDTSCVNPTTFWSCDLPKELQPTIAPNAANQPNFRLQIQWDNSSEANATFANVTGDKNLPVKRNTECYDISANQFFKRLFLGLRQTTLGFDPIPSAPSFSEEFFLGNTTDSIVSPEKAGEPTPFYITFLSPTADVSADLNILRKRESSSSNASSSFNSSSDNSFPDIINGIPAPSINTADGTASPANLLPSPLPIQQPLRLFDRALPTEHYGFYSYFDRSIFLSSVNLTTGSGVVPSDQNGGATEEEAKFRCTWAQTRFRVQIWTNMGTSAQLNNITDVENGGDNTQISNPKQPSRNITANNFYQPGSFPYPITLTLDRHGGNADLKEIYCYQVGEGEPGGVTYLDVHPTLQLENRGAGGTLISPAPSVFDANSSTEKALGGIDGGTGGCKCGWQNFAAAT